MSPENPEVIPEGGNNDVPQIGDSVVEVPRSAMIPILAPITPRNIPQRSEGSPLQYGRTEREWNEYLGSPISSVDESELAYRAVRHRYYDEFGRVYLEVVDGTSESEEEMIEIEL